MRIGEPSGNNARPWIAIRKELLTQWWHSALGLAHVKRVKKRRVASWHRSEPAVPNLLLLQRIPAEAFPLAAQAYLEHCRDTIKIPARENPMLLVRQWASRIDALEKRLQDAVRPTLEQSDEWITAWGVSDIWGCSDVVANGHAKRHGVSTVKVGGRIFYSRSEVVATPPPKRYLRRVALADLVLERAARKREREAERNKQTQEVRERLDEGLLLQRERHFRAMIERFKEKHSP